MLPTDITAISPTAPVVKRVHVRANAARAFQVFTEGIDSWWPRTHHIGSSPMTRAVIEGHLGGRCYSDQEDGTQCPWGQVTLWDPPARFILSWQVTHDWHFEPDLGKCSEVEVTFTPHPDGSTDVVLEHRNFERHGAGGANMRAQVNQDGGWNGLMQLYRTVTEKMEEPT